LREGVNREKCKTNIFCVRLLSKCSAVRHLEIRSFALRYFNLVSPRSADRRARGVWRPLAAATYLV